MNAFKYSVATLLLLLVPMGSRAQEKAAAEPPRAGNYQLSVGDVIAIKIFREPDLDSQHRIAKDGTIDFPLIRSVKVVGKTTAEAQTVIAALLDKDYLVRPQVTIDVVSYNKQRVTILGQVASAGSYAIPDEGSMTLVQAIAAAGGFTRLADLAHVIVQRQSGEQIIVDARPGNKAAQGVQISPNDTITVKERLF